MGEIGCLRDAKRMDIKVARGTEKKWNDALP